MYGQLILMARRLRPFAATSANDTTRAGNTEWCRNRVRLEHPDRHQCVHCHYAYIPFFQNLCAVNRLSSEHSSRCAGDISRQEGHAGPNPQ